MSMPHTTLICRPARQPTRAGPAAAELYVAQIYDI